ncbi:MAG TPA: exodeoxyribonuclease VII small subunit [Candidatus Saccharimonadaceae bacterium]|jgi:exodeoxyribonuclease VII small subunit|nr:exodeoxyribonuclease VII small subunit [Candidatus Saccharimonadaceae bacterium]
MAAKKNPPAAESGEAPSFETALGRLESIVDELEGGELSLEESIARYEEGMKLSRRLTQTLDEAEKRVEKLVESGDDAPPTTRAMELDLAPGEEREGKLPF